MAGDPGHELPRPPADTGIADRVRRAAGRLWSRPSPGAPPFFLARRLFLRLLGVVYLAAFLSLWVQVHGLIGSRGILSVGEYLADVRAVTGPERYALVPTLCWLDAGDGFLDGLCGAGVVLSGLLL